MPYWENGFLRYLLVLLLNVTGKSGRENEMLKAGTDAASSDDSNATPPVYTGPSPGTG